MTADSDSLFVTSWHAHKFYIISLSGRNLGRNWPQTREIAADRVVLPWSTWPMVPMFTWGCKRDRLQKQEHYNVVTTIDPEHSLTKHRLKLCLTSRPWHRHDGPLLRPLTGPPHCQPSLDCFAHLMNMWHHVTKHHCQASTKLRALRLLRLNPAACYKLCKEARRL